MTVSFANAFINAIINYNTQHFDVLHSYCTMSISSIEEKKSLIAVRIEHRGRGCRPRRFASLLRFSMASSGIQRML